MLYGRDLRAVPVARGSYEPNARLVPSATMVNEIPPSRKRQDLGREKKPRRNLAPNPSEQNQTTLPSMAPAPNHH